MKQLLKKNQGTKIIVLALMLTMVAWLAPVNVGVAKAADDLSMNTSQSKTLKVSSKKPLYKRCAGQIYYYRDKKDNTLEVHFRKASSGKIKLYLVKGLYGSDYSEQTPVVTGKVKGNTVKFTVKKWYSYDEGGAMYTNKQKISGTIILKSTKTIKLKVTSGKPGPYDGAFLRKGKTTTLKCQ